MSPRPWLTGGVLASSCPATPARSLATERRATMSDLPDQFVLRPKANCSVYHTSDCIAVSRAGEQEARPVTDRNIEWHEWDVCAYCAGEAQAGGDTS